MRPEPRPPGMTVCVSLLALAASAFAQTTPSLHVAASTRAAAFAQEERAPDPVWRPVDPDHTVYLELPAGRVVIELAPDFAPLHVAQILRLVREGHFDGAGVVRSQDNYVAQWAMQPAAPSASAGESAEGAGESENEPPTGSQRKPPPPWFRAGLPAEFERPSQGLSWFGLPDPDTYAAEVGFVAGLPVARTGRDGTSWIVHCYGVVGVARDTDADTGSGAQLYAVTGQAPRHLDRNLTMVGRVVEGMEFLTTLPRGTEALGFYAADEEIVPIRAARVAADVPEAERSAVEIMRTDTDAFRAFVDGRRNRTDPFFVHPAGAIDVCNVRVPSRRPMP